MGAEEAGLYAIHLLAAGVWTGSVVFVTLAILPAARDGNLNAAPLELVTGRLRWISRISAVVLLLTGLRMAMTGGYLSTDVLLGTTSGYLLVAMVVLWFVLMALVEVGSGKLADGTNRKKVREPARQARPFFLAGSLVAVLLLVDAGLITGLPL
jgi:uncharacterized membrane protein